MAKKQSIVEEAIIQMKNLEEVIEENAKGILASTMKQEIGELVKESLKKTEEEESKKSDVEEQMTDDDMDTDSDEDTDMEDTGIDSEMDSDMEDDDMTMDIETDEDDMDFDMEDDDVEMDFDMEDDDVIDMTNASHDDLIKIFKEMSDDDGIIVRKEGDTIDIEDSNEDVHYKVSLGEQEEMDEEMEEDYDSLDEEMDEEMEEDELVFEIEMDEEMDEELDEEMDEEMYEGVDEELDEEMDEYAEEKMITKEGFKPKGMGMGKPGKVYPKKLKNGVTETEKNPTVKKSETKEGMKSIKPKGMGMGKPKFEYKEVKKVEMKPAKKGGETSEASRTLGTGKYFGKKGLPKPKAAPRHLKVESTDKEINLLRERNEEYRKALNLFRTQLNKVAVFNSNLAYATRLFTEHSTTKQEKLNILRRFDGIETLKESKTLYKTIKDELSSENAPKVMKESLQDKIEKTPASGSAINLIESKTYENPQFMRMKDLMTKMNVIK